MTVCSCFFFFFKQKTAYEMRISDWSSDVCSSDLDPEFADATYVEPITPEIVAKIIEKERPDAVLPTMGGQTALNTALALFNDGTLDKFGVKMIGADAAAIDKAEDRLKFRDAMDKIGQIGRDHV